MRIPSGKTDQYLFFVAVDSVDYATKKTGLSGFTVYRSRNGGTAMVYTTPTVVELSAANMPGVYALLIDEDTTIASTSDSEEYVVYITKSGMAPVTRTVELFRRDTTAGRTITVDANGGASVGAVLAAASNIKKNTALAGFSFVMTDSITHLPAAGLTVTATRSIDGGAFAACTNSAAAISNGAYKIDLSAADLNGNNILFRFTALGADDTFIPILTQA
jgi:hypothetical protein